eukprot:Lankesteria_metandrocarpae@DN4765_c0_g1_i12.p1
MVVCEECGQAEAIYVCPGCHRRSCSLICVKRHKSTSSEQESGCDGKLKMFSASVATLREYTQETLLEDYTFLERVAQSCESAARLTARAFASRNKRDPTQRRLLAPHLLRRAAYDRGITLRTCPVDATIRKDNTSSLINNPSNKRVRLGHNATTSKSNDSESLGGTTEGECTAVNSLDASAAAHLSAESGSGHAQPSIVASPASTQKSQKLKWRCQWILKVLPPVNKTSEYVSESGTRNKIEAIQHPVFIDPRASEDRRLIDLLVRFPVGQSVPVGYTEAAMKKIFSQIAEERVNGASVPSSSAEQRNISSEYFCPCDDVALTPLENANSAPNAQSTSDVALGKCESIQDDVQIGDNSSLQGVVPSSAASMSDSIKSLKAQRRAEEAAAVALCNKFLVVLLESSAKDISGNKQYYVMDLEVTLAQNLRGTAFVEFPHFVVLDKKTCGLYSAISKNCQ